MAQDKMKTDESPSRFRFPWRDGNRFDLLIDGEVFISRMIESMESAQNHILLELYLVESGRNLDRFMDVFRRAVARGVTVKLLIDAWGSWNIQGADRDLLLQAGIDMAFHNPLHYAKWLSNLTRDHRKLLIIDGTVAYVGGAGITDDFDPVYAQQSAWHEVMVEIRGPVLHDWHILFADEWLRSSGRSLAIPGPSLQVLAGTQRGRVVCAGYLRDTGLGRSVYAQIRHAQYRVWLVTPYFVPSGKLRRLLKRSARSGVDVRLLVPGPQIDVPMIKYAARRFYARLLRQGVRIFEYQPRFVHAKLLLTQQWASIGSSNLDRWNLHWNLEANQEIDDEGFARDVEAMFLRDFALSTEWTYERWCERPWRNRCVEFISGMLNTWLSRIRHTRMP